MARSKKGKKKAYRVDFAGVETSALVPEADYPIVPVKITGEEGPAGDYWAWEFKITSGKFKGKKLYYNTSLAPQALWNLRGVLEAFGYGIAEKAVDLTIEEVLEEIGETEAGCTVEHEKYKKRNKAKIVDVFDLENLDASEEDGEDGGDEELPSEDELSEMDEDELEEVIDDHTLEVELGDFKGIKKKRKAVLAALEESAEESTEEEEEEEADEKPTDGEVKKMSKDELEEVIDDHNLDVDLDEFKSLKKKRDAIIEALEESGEDDEEEGTTYSEEEIDAMKGKELKALVKEIELDVELTGKTKKDRRLVKAALDEEDLLSS